jgi:hypothetical protein
MQAVKITQITSPVKETLIENSIKKGLPLQLQTKALDTDRRFNLTELCDYLTDKPREITIFLYIHSNLHICHYPPKRLQFLKPKIDSWLGSCHKKTTSKNNWIKVFWKAKRNLTIEVIRLIIVLTKLITVLLG